MISGSKMQSHSFFTEMALFSLGKEIRGIKNVQLIFDWCKWDWEIDGKYGVWDEDFRFNLYSMNITKLTVEQVRRKQGRFHNRSCCVLLGRGKYTKTAQKTLKN